MFKPIHLNNIRFGDLTSTTGIITLGINPLNLQIEQSKYAFIQEIDNPQNKIDLLIRNLLANPQITNLVILGNPNLPQSILIQDLFKNGVELSNNKWKIRSDHNCYIHLDILKEDIIDLLNTLSIIWLDDPSLINSLELQKIPQSRKPKFYPREELEQPEVKEELKFTEPEPEIESIEELNEELSLDEDDKEIPEGLQDYKEEPELTEPITEISEKSIEISEQLNKQPNIQTNIPQVNTEELILKIKDQIGSNGEKGWPVAVKDRISYPALDQDIVTNSNIAVIMLWTIRDAILPKINKEKLALVTNFYTPAGLEGMIRNILANPFIRYVIMLGNEYASKKDQGDLEQTSANAVRQFFKNGINEKRKLEGFEQAVNFDKNIPTELINKVAKEVQLIDLNDTNSTLQEKIEQINKLINTLENKPPFLEQPLTFEYEQIDEPFPYEGSAMIARGKTIPETWIEIMHIINRYGVKNLMDENTDREIKEINNLTATIHDPQNMDLSINPFLVSLTEEKIKAYQQEVLSPDLPEGKAYTYGNKLRAFEVQNSQYVKNLATSPEYKNFEFPRELVDKNIKYHNGTCAIDQIDDIIEVLKRNKNIKSTIALTWHVEDELLRKHKSSPCLVLIQPLLQNDKLNLFVYFRSHDMVQGWPENAYGCAAIQKHIADSIGVETGIITIVSGSAQIYKHYYQQVEEMLQKFYKYEVSYHDAKGNYVIQIINNEIVVKLLHPVSNRELEIFKGTRARKLSLDISSKVRMFDAFHAMYLGNELLKAELALKNKLNYEQDKDLEIKFQEPELIKEVIKPIIKEEPKIELPKVEIKHIQKPQELPKEIFKMPEPPKKEVDVRKGELNLNKILNNLKYNKR